MAGSDSQRAPDAGRPPGPGQLLEGRFRLRRLLGRGGMGSVFLGVDEELAGRQVAIKFMTLGRDETALKRFQREAEVTAQLDHPHVIRIHGAGQHGEQAYIVYELVEGKRSLADAMASASLEQRLDWIEQIAAGLAAAHAQGIVHRDLKPENVLIRPSAQAVVLDFGLAGLDASSLTNTGQVLGTPAYMSPEQLRGEAPTPACDVWSLGLLLYEAVYERHAFLEEGLTLQFLLAKVYAAQVDFPRGPAPGLRSLLQASLKGDSEKRPPDAGAFGSALRAARASRGRAPLRRTLLAGLVLLAGAGLGLWAFDLVLLEAPTPAPAPPASREAGPDRTPRPGSSRAPGSRPSPRESNGPKGYVEGSIPAKLPLAPPDFVLDMGEVWANQVAFVSNDEALFVGRRGHARIWRLGGQAPVARGPAWRLPITSRQRFALTAGPQVVVISEDQAWRLTVAEREPIALPPLPFVPAEVGFWERGSRFYLLIACKDRVACGVLGAPLRELDIAGYQVKEVSGAANRVVILAQKLPLKSPGVLVFNLGEPGSVWIPLPSPSAITQSPEGDRLLVGSRFGSLEVRSGAEAGSVTVLVAAHEGSLRDVAWAGPYLAGLSKRSLSIWNAADLRSPRFLGSLPAGAKADEVTLSPQGDLVIVRRDFEFLGWRLPVR